MSLVNWATTLLPTGLKHLGISKSTQKFEAPTEVFKAIRDGRYPSLTLVRLLSGDFETHFDSENEGEWLRALEWCKEKGVRLEYWTGRELDLNGRPEFRSTTLM
jgi:hypothetical protein